MNKKLVKNKIGEEFGFGMFIVFLSMAISLFAFISEENQITGLVTFEAAPQIVVKASDLIDIKDINSLGSLATGNYYVDENGVVYWIDDESRPAVAQLNNFDENLKNKEIYIDKYGRIGYVLNPVLSNQNNQNGNQQ